MKNKKGFTLIELLAVIVILAVIALIATPIIIGVIEQARKKAFENTAYGVLEGLRLNYTERILTGTTSEEKTFSFPNSGLKLSGEEPAYGSAKIDGKGNISFALADRDKKWCAKKESDSEKVTMEDYNVETCKIDEEVGETGGATLVPPTGEDTHKGIVYLDPTYLQKECNESNSVSDTGTKEGCMKWYIYDDSGDTYKLLLDHNTTAKVAWNSDGENNEMKEIKTKLGKDVATWLPQLNARLITADEIASITKNQQFDSAIAETSDEFFFDTNTDDYDPDRGPGTSKYAWLFDRTYDCTEYGCDEADDLNYGYWTSTAIYDSSSNVWVVSYKGHISNSNASTDDKRGIRPVIEISKSLLK